MIDLLTIVIALVIITILVGFFGFLAWKINMSDPVIRDENNQLADSTSEKKRKEKNTHEQTKRKRKDQKKSRRENKDDGEKQQQQRNKPSQTSEETDDEQEESEQELLIPSVQTVETSSKARKRNKNKTGSSTPPPPASTTTSLEGNTKTRAPPATHPKSTPKDELESSKQQSKGQVSNKPPVPPTTKKPTQTVQQQQEQPFTVVGANRHKTRTPPLQQQQNKPQATVTSSVAPVQQLAPVQVQQEQLPQRQQLPQKETPAPVNLPLPVKQQQQQQAPKIADLIKVLPSSQAVVTELMSALDAFPLSTEELDIIMHKIANKQSVVKQDWNKLQHGQKVDPQEHIGQVLDESARAYEDELKNNAMKRIKELTDELNLEKRRNLDLLKDKTDKDREVHILHAQLDSIQQRKPEPSASAHPQQKLQTLELQLQRLTEENLHLNHQLSQQAPHTNEASNMKVQVLSEQMKKLSVENAQWEKKALSNELLAKEAQKEKQDLIRYNEQLTQSLQNAEKDLKHIEEKHHQQSKETRTTHLNDINEYKRRIQQLENDNEQLKREEIVHVEPSTTATVNNQEREELENEIQQLKQTVEHLQNQHQSQENEFKQEIERLKNNNEQQQVDESRNHELQILRAELTEVKSQSEERLRQDREKQRRVLTELLSQDLRRQLPHDNQDFDQWFSSYRQLSESSQRNLQEESASVKRENDLLHKNMADVENQLRDIEKTIESKEEALLSELKSKDANLENIRGENDQLKGELQRLRNDLQRLQSAHDSSVSEARALKHQLDERFHVAANNNNTPSIVAADESFELVKQPSPSLSPIVIDVRADQFNESIPTSKDSENETSASTVSSSNQQS